MRAGARMLLAEYLGTLAIVFFGCGAIATVSLADGAAGRLLVNAVFGLTVAGCIYALSHISGAHFNPAVTVALAASGRFAWRLAPGYVAAQVAGAASACGLHRLLIGPAAAACSYGATTPALPPLAALATEALLTLFLVLVIMAAATDARAAGATAGLAIGAVVMLCGLVGGPLTGCSMNPARSLGPALFAGGPALRSLWVFCVGPLCGGLAAAGLYEAIRGDGARQAGPSLGRTDVY